jgi:hypothetical protein
MPAGTVERNLPKCGQGVPRFFAFDLLWLNNRDIRDLPQI